MIGITTRCRQRLTAILISVLSPLAVGAATPDGEPHIKRNDPVVRPPALRLGNTIGIIAPGHPLERKRIEQARTRLSAMGFETRVVGDVYARRGYLAGSDKARADALMQAYRDPDIHAIFCGTGGYGTTRLLERLDFAEIRRHPKILLGFSDITALHLAVHQRTGQITFHGPNLMWGLGSLDANLTPFASAHLWRTLCLPETVRTLAERSAEQADGPGSLPGITPDSAQAWTYPISYDLNLCRPETTSPVVLRPGRATGRITGGNLSLICALMGTPWEIRTRGRILFLEDVNEAPYRIDRFLRQLKQAGKLDHVAGVVLGRWRKCESDKPAESLSLDEVFADYFGDAPYPVILRFPAGHVRDNATLPIGGMAELNTAPVSLTLLEQPVK